MFDLFGPAYPQSYGQHPYGRKQYYDPEEYAYLLQRQRQEEARREALKRKELERLYLQQQYEREQAYLEQQERQRLIQKKIQEEKKRRKMEKKKRQEEERILEEERKKAQLWAEYVNNPEVREKSATTIQSTWRGYSERRNQVLERLRKLSPFQNRIVQLLAENQTFLNDLIQNPLPSILETFEENEKKSNKDLLWKVAAYEEQLTKELLNLDAISSGRSEFVRNCRRDLVNKINAHLELIDPVKKQLSQRQSEINEKERLFLEEKERLQKQLEEEQIIATESEETPMEETAVQHPQELENVKEEESRETEPDYQVSDITEDGFEIIPSEVEKETPMELEDNSSHDDSTPTTLSKEEELLQIIAKLKQENEEKDMIISQLRSHLESKNQSETQAM